MLEYVDSISFKIKRIKISYLAKYDYYLKLKAFLKQRYSEMSEGENLLTSTIMQDAPKAIQNMSEKGI